ncbi:HECT-domain-containing protein [Pseudocohnilembus persalinus]|uniref:HECT-type E3 ubiquitin transferase n=1 Tax=Pseudocohnilembus persalinus TaxID=266149 RepID=A0A0V0QIJ8_PSEPJ|nr:HECT-domain-containing protein [Pseudocohnilembus persalinus]|eukprot:KRX01861.1 HECT-domain-containing protein [Pseudocohnilembus persalinus]
MEEEKNDDYFKKQKLQLSDKFLLLPQCLEIKNSIYFILKNNQELIGKMFQLILKNFQEYLEQQQQNFNLFKKSFKEIDKYKQQNITNIQAKTLVNLVQLWKLYIDQRSNNKNNSEYNIEDIPQFLNLFVLTLEKYNYNISCIIQEELKEVQKQNEENMDQNELDDQGTNLKNIAFKKQQMGSIIAFFTRIYNQRVEMLDDREFFNDDEIFQIKQSELDINSKNFSIKELLKELYNRDQRKQYCQKNFWVIEQADTNINNNNFFSLIQQQQLQMNQNQLQQIQQQQHKDLFQQIINEIPHIFSFEKRHKYFNQMRSEDHLKQGPNRDPLQFYQINFNMFNGQEDDEDQLQLNMNHERVIQVVRGEEFEVGYDKMLNANLKHLYKIQYQNEHGIAEAGIDGGGLQKEFITNIINYALNPQNGFFVETGDKTLIPNKENGDLSLYYYIGKIVGKAIYEDILIEPIFSPIFLNQILEKKNNIEELYYLDKDQYKSLMYLKHMKDDILDLDLNFSIDEQHKNKQTGQFETKKIELKPQGDIIPVTNENKLEYIMLYADYKLNKSTQKQVKAFRDGFTQTVNQQWLMMFNHEELQLLISGNFQKFDIQDLKNNTVYNGYNANDQTIKEFWEVLQEFTIEQKKQLLYFVTSCSRPPTLGFKSLEPKFSIQISIGPNYQQNLDKLPTSSTCMNILKLPNYKNKQKLKEKLITAISSKSGFDLT